jgi:hypothetical protein
MGHIWPLRAAGHTGRLLIGPRPVAADVARDARFCRIADVARAHIHALLGMFHRSLMAAMVVDSAVSFRYQGKPIADYECLLVE